MNRPIIASLAALLCSASAQAQREHARFDFPFVVNGQEHLLTYEGTHDVMRQADPAVKLVVLVHHGGSQNSVTYFQRMRAALDAAAADRPGLNLPTTTMIIAPAMIGERHLADSPGRYSGKNYAYWDNGWREGKPSLSKPQVSNFDLLDGLVLHIADRFPNVKAIVHVGHSAGGQLLSRYSFGSPLPDVLRQRGIHVRYVIANPSSVLYFDRQRPDLVSGKGFIDYRLRAPVVADSLCHEFNSYKYGLDGMVPYMTRRPVSAMLAAFRTRDVYVFLGTSDIDPNADGLDKDCPAMLQGRFRLERGQRYYEYLGHFFGPEIFQTKFLVLAPGVAHSGGEMFKSDAGKPIIFINADSAAAALRRVTERGSDKAVPLYFNPSTLPLARRRIASFNRLSFVSSRLADSIQARYRRRCEGGSASKWRDAAGCFFSAAWMYRGSLEGSGRRAGRGA
jgi:hypothetical protein